MTYTLQAASVDVPPVDALTSGLVDDAFIYITGQLAYDASLGGVVAADNSARQTEVIFDRIEALLAAEGATLDDLRKVTIYIVDIGDLMPMNAVYARRLGRLRPARSTLGVAFLALPGARVEIEAVARRPRRRND